MTSQDNEFHHWCADHDHPSMPTSAAAISTYLTALATHGAKVGTMSRRLSAIKFAHRLRDLPDPTKNARVVAVWEGIRREHTTKPDQARPLMPPQLWDVLEACLTTKNLPGQNPARRSSPCRLARPRADPDQVRRRPTTQRDRRPRPHPPQRPPQRTVIDLPRSKTNQRGTTDEIVVLPRGSVPRRCPVTTLQAWLNAAQINDGAVFQPVSKGNRPSSVGSPPRPSTISSKLPPSGQVW